MANPFRAFPPRKGGDALWSDTGPAGTILRTGFFGAPPSAQTLTTAAFTDADSFGAATVANAGGATGTLNLLEQNAGTTNIADVVTGTITITAGRPAFAILVGVGDLATSGSPHSLSGAGQTWTQIYSAPVAGDDVDYTRCSIWVSDAAAGGSGVLTFSTPDQSAWAYAVVEFQPSSGATATIGTEVEATIAQNATTNSVALGAADYWVALAGASKASGYGSLSATPRAGWTEVADSVALDTGWLAGVHVQISPLDGDTDASLTWSQLVNIPLVAVPITLTGGGGGGQTLTATIYADGDTFGAASISVGAVTLTGTVYSDADAFGAATVTRGAVSLSATIYADGDSFGAASISVGAVTLSPTLFADADAFGAHTVSPGAVTITGAVYVDPDAFGAATVSQGGATQDLTATAFSDGDAFGAAVVTRGAVTVSPTTYSDADTFGAAVVSQGATTLSPARYDDPDAFGAATITTGAVSLGATAFADPDTFGSATVSRGAVAVSPSLLANVSTFGAAIVAPGAATISAAVYPDPDQFGAAAVSIVVPAPIDPERIAYVQASARLAALEAAGRSAAIGAAIRLVAPDGQERQASIGAASRIAYPNEDTGP